MKRLLYICFALLSFVTYGYPYKILFDYTKEETAGNADWIPDRDFPLPAPQHPIRENDWDGAISAFAFGIKNILHDTVFTLHDYPITYNDSTNPYDLSNFDVFIIPEPQNPFTQSEKDAIRKFVENGGGLFLISDHNNSDRNHSGWDSPRVLNDLGTQELFGMHFNTTGEANNYFTYTSSNIADFTPITDGPVGRVTDLAFHGGTSISLAQNYNQNVKGIIFKNTDHTGCMFAISRFGKGKIAGIGDSSPLDDGTGDPHDRLYNGWQEEGSSHKNLFLNATTWLEGRNDSVLQPVFVLDGHIDSTSAYIGGNSGISIFSSENDSTFYIAFKFSYNEHNKIYAVFSTSPHDYVPTPWARDGYIGNFNFYMQYSLSTHTISIKDSRGIGTNLPIGTGASDSVLECTIPKNILNGDTLYVFSGVFSSESYKMLFTYPPGKNENGITYYNYIPFYFYNAVEHIKLKPPIISQGFTESTYTNRDALIYTFIFDNRTITSASMYYRIQGDNSFRQVQPDSIEAGKYFFTISPIATPSPVEYYFSATDDEGNTSRTITYTLNIIDNPYRVYFENDTLIQKLKEFIDSAQSSIDICMYEVFNPEIANALIAAYQRGISIRVITDSSYFNRGGITSMSNAGITIIHEGIGPNSTNHIMHNKIVIRDYNDQDTTNDIAWTGSFNASEELHIDNAIAIQSHELCKLFEQEFNQMWGSQTQTPDPQNAKTGRRKSDVVSTHRLLIGNDDVSLYFSPQDSAIQYIINMVKRAQNSIYYLIFSFTRSDLKDALINAHQRGVIVEGVHEDNSRDNDRLNTVFNDLRSSGCRVYWAQVPGGYTFLHDKIMIIDSQYVVTGSMNWTQSANDDNDENILIIKNGRIASMYLNKFKEVYDYSRRPSIEAKTIIGGSRGTTVIYYDMLKHIKGTYDIFTISGQELGPADNIVRGIYFLKDKNSKSIKKILILK